MSNKLEDRAGKMKPPFPTKFRVGDICEITESAVIYNKGDLVEIVNVCRDNLYLVKDAKGDDPHNWYITEHRLILIEPREELWGDDVEFAAPSASEKAASTKQIGGSHYSKLAIQPFTYAYHNNLNCGQFNALKYITRYKDKNGIEDLKKAIHCLELLIEHEEQIND